MNSKQSYSIKRKNTDTDLKHKHLSRLEFKRDEADDLRKKYKSLKATHKLQNRTVRHFMHNIMSPLSAVSGYHELLSNKLDITGEGEKLNRYAGNIGEGLNQIGFLLEQLHEIFKEDDFTDDESESPVVELNWLVNEVVTIVSNSSGIKSKGIHLTQSDTPAFVKAELFQLKLMIYNLVTTADCLSTGDGSLEIEVNHDETDFALLIKNTGSLAADESFMKIFENRELVRLSENLEESSTHLSGLRICAQIAGLIEGQIILDNRGHAFPQFILTAPMAKN